MNYTNNPVIIPVPYTDHNTRSGSTITKAVSFHQLILTVTASCNGKSVTHEFSSPCSNTGSGNIDFDIHTCLQAAAENYAWSPTNIGAAPTVSYTVKYHEEYLLDGESVSTSETEGTDGSAVIGGLTDFERAANVNTKTTSKPCALPSTHKNYSPQVAASDEVVVVSGSTVTSSAKNVYRMSEKLEDIPDRYVFRFVNRYGCVESIGVECRRETEMNVSLSEFSISRPDYLSSDIRRARYTKQNDYETWKCSSGPLDRPWQQWFAHEFLMAENIWIMIDGSWYRVHITTEDAVVLLNRADGSLLSVSFSIRFDMNGSPV